LIFILFFTISCSKTKSEQKHFNDLGEISFDSKIDDVNFLICQEDKTFPFNYGGVGLVYNGEKRALAETFYEYYSYPKTQGQTGYITIRFIINCEGKTGRYRLSEMDINLKEKKFDKNITKQFMNITKKLDGWQPFVYDEKTWDYQQYLAFKIIDGELKKVLP